LRQRSSSAAATEALGAQVARDLVPGDIVLVSGELGAGKTTFVRGAARELGVTVPVTSPTYTIGQRYPGRIGVSHLDLYRLGSLAEEDPDLLAEYFGEDRVVFVEWPEGEEQGISDLGRIAARVRILHAGPEVREIELA
jgi:tRNA threonylcarbamoyladenosine biosynthesis protein TsaE